MDARIQCELLWERGRCLNVVITGDYRDTYAHYWTWLDDRIASSKHSLREGRRAGYERNLKVENPWPFVREAQTLPELFAVAQAAPVLCLATLAN